MGPENSDFGTAFGPSPWEHSRGHFTREGQCEAPWGTAPSVLHAGLQSCLSVLICKGDMCLLQGSMPSFLS